ncbi:hypothetical protein LPJ73_006772, partial [Coemansia sp. RSA 2703]
MQRNYQHEVEVARVAGQLSRTEKVVRLGLMSGEPTTRVRQRLFRHLAGLPTTPADAPSSALRSPASTQTHFSAYSIS